MTRDLEPYQAPATPALRDDKHTDEERPVNVLTDGTYDSLFLKSIDGVIYR